MPLKFGWFSGKPRRPPPGAGIAQTGSRCFSARATACSQPPDASTSGPATMTGFAAAESCPASDVIRSAGAAGAVRDRATDRMRRRVGWGLDGPVVHRHRDEGRAPGRHRGRVDRPADRRRHVLGTLVLESLSHERRLTSQPRCSACCAQDDGALFRVMYSKRVIAHTFDDDGRFLHRDAAALRRRCPRERDCHCTCSENIARNHVAGRFERLEPMGRTTMRLPTIPWRCNHRRLPRVGT